MTPQTLKALDHRLQRFLEDLLEPLGRSERRHGARVYVHGLLLDGDRQSIEPLATRVAGADVQALQQFVGQSPWAVEEVQRRMARKAVDWLSQPEVWILDATAFPKAGQHSVGVARQYCGTLGKVAHCQVAVSLHWSSAEASGPIRWRLYRPKEGLEDKERAAAVKLPPGTSYRSQAELALEIIAQALAWELPHLPVVADSFYGNEFGFRQALRERHLPYAVQVEPSIPACRDWTEDPHRPLPPPKKTGRPRKYPPREALPRPQALATVANQLPGSAWRTVAWREGSRGVQRSRFAQIQVWAGSRLAETGTPAAGGRMAAGGMAPGIRATDPILAGALGRAARRVASLGPHRPRRAGELDYRELKEELGLDHYEGRHWLGWHHPVCLVTMAFLFLRSEQARLKKNFGCDLAEREEETTALTH